MRKLKINLAALRREARKAHDYAAKQPAYNQEWRSSVTISNMLHELVVELTQYYASHK